MMMRLKEFLTLEEVEEARGDLNQEVSGLAYDSRNVGPGKIFFAISGEKLDGHDFIPQAIEREAGAVVAAKKHACPPDTTSIRVRDVRRIMGLWSAHFFGWPSRQLKLVGVTGTNGKTTVTYLVESIFSAAGMEPGLIGTISYRYRGREVPSHHTTPESLDLEALLADMCQAGTQAVAMEVSSHALAQERVRGLEFDVAVFTNLSRDHLDYHADMDDYFLAKSRLFTDHLKNGSKPKRAAVICGEDPHGKELLKTVRDQGLEVWSYGEGAQWDIHPLDVRSDVQGLKGKLELKGQIFDFSSPLIGSANLQNIMGAAGVGLALGVSAQVVSEGIQRLTAVPGRLEKVENDLGISILVDYAHTPDALEKVLRALRGIMPGLESRVSSLGSEQEKTPTEDAKPETRDPKLICVFGCGGDRDRGKRPLMGEIAARLSDLVVLTSDNPRTEEPLAILHEIEMGVRKTGLTKFPVPSSGSRVATLPTRNSEPKTSRGYCVEADRREAIRIALRLSRPGDVVLIAGKGHEDYQILGEKKIHFDDREVARQELGRIATT
jgi:UDP-N-acetylmuramoyl-L-alanyl-D-glutamate--2,6-diaminopimelate ligase